MSTLWLNVDDSKLDAGVEDYLRMEKDEKIPIPPYREDDDEDEENELDEDDFDNDEDDIDPEDENGDKE